MGAAGYPLLFATGETADGRTPLVDRQHPHNLVMELSASLGHALSPTDSAYLYAGLPGEPAFGPPAFVHRFSIMDSPEAPISHHWLDSTHVTLGVVTAGFVHGDWKLEASRFHGREPDQHRYAIESGALDSGAARLSWNPTAQLSAQISWAQQTSPEQLAPTEDQRKWSASALWTRQLAGQGTWSSTLAVGRRRNSGAATLSAWALESALRPGPAWEVFWRGERTDQDELVAVAAGHGPVYAVAKTSLGAIRYIVLAPHLTLGLGALYALNFVPAALTAAYGHDPAGGMLFVQLRVE